MSMAYLGERFEVHGGGGDLIFPHHESELAQSEGATGDRRWSRTGRTPACSATRARR